MAVCVLFNAGPSSPNFIQFKSSSHQKNNSINTLDNSDQPSDCQTSLASAQRLIITLFEHCIQTSVLLESLCMETFNAICPINPSKGTHYTDIISHAFIKFSQSFYDLFAVKMSFPVWHSLNNALSLGVDLESSILPDQFQSAAYFQDIHSSQPSTVVHEKLAESFIHGCILPLVSKANREMKYFLAQLITGLLMLHPGWACSCLPGGTSNASTASTLLTTANNLRDQILLQAGCANVSLSSGGGAIFNSTVLYGQSRRRLLILLHFATYFLRSLVLSCPRETVPDMGRGGGGGDQRIRSKNRRKTGSSNTNLTTNNNRKGGVDSGINSQEDLFSPTASSVSPTLGGRGSLKSPPPGSRINTLFVMMQTTALSRDQLRVAEEAARRVHLARQSSQAPQTAASRYSSSDQLQVQQSRRQSKQQSKSSRLYSTGMISSPSYDATVYPTYTEVALLNHKVIDRSPKCSCLAQQPCPSPPHLLTTSQQRATANNSASDATTTNSDSQPSSSACSSQGSSPLTNPLPDLQDLSIQGNPPPWPSLTNHSLIGASVSDQFHDGLALQATHSPLDHIKQRLEAQAKRWLIYGPLVIRGKRLLTRPLPLGELLASIPKDASGWVIDPNRLNRPAWTASSLLVNTDLKSVELVTLRTSDVRQSPAPEEAATVDDAPRPATNQTSSVEQSADTATNNSVANSQTISAMSLTTNPIDQHPVNNSNNRIRTSSWTFRRYTSQTATASSPSSPTSARPGPSTFTSPSQLRPSPLIAHLVESMALIAERIECPVAALRGIDDLMHSTLCGKASVLTDLLLMEGPDLLGEPDRMCLAAGCSPDDLPLLLTAVSIRSLPAALILNSYHSDWWIA